MQLFETRDEFLDWERATHDVIAVNRCYIDLADDALAGLFLSQLMYYQTLTADGGERLTIENDGELWLAKKREDWWDECRVSPRQVDRIVKSLRDLGLIETKTLQFGGVPIMHIRVVWETFLPKVKVVIPTRVDGVINSSVGSRRPLGAQQLGTAKLWQVPDDLV